MIMTRQFSHFASSLLAATLVVSLGSCASAKKFFGTEQPTTDHKPINNPFGDFYSNQGPESRQPMILRSKKGDRSIEVELPKSEQNISDLVIPISPSFKENDRTPASDPSLVDESLHDHAPTAADREITSRLNRTSGAISDQRRDVEGSMGLKAPEDSAPDQDKSYLAQIDHVKQLFKASRYEAALMETDELIKHYPMDPKTHQMRGTLFDRVGQKDLALKEWKQALRLDPGNQSLKKYIERREQVRGLANE